MPKIKKGIIKINNIINAGNCNNEDTKTAAVAKTKLGSNPQILDTFSPSNKKNEVIIISKKMIRLMKNQQLCSKALLRPGYIFYFLMCSEQERW